MYFTEKLSLTMTVNVWFVTGVNTGGPEIWETVCVPHEMEYHM